MKRHALMVLGTASGVGKSLLTAGLCRLASRAGVRVAPFKAQNMSNNAAACPSGGEIGRAQALQAFACGIEPTTDMNPVLIKPETDQQAQLVVRGVPRGILRADRFREDRRDLLPIALESFERLHADYDWLWVEGAGSPAEPNLRQGDLANLGFAEAANLDAWLVGDIDRGGVFAALLGTLAVLDAPDRERIRALVINRFRGSPDLLAGTSEWLSQRSERPVLGVVPNVADLCLPDEDAPYRLSQLSPRGGAPIRVAAIDYPTASNTTDLDALSLDANVDLRLVREPEGLTEIDLAILPGSKAVRGDLDWLRRRGFVAALERHLRYGGLVMGICGGMQMLGESISDPTGVEGGGEFAGLGWLPATTELTAEKEVRALEATAVWPGAIRFRGYEIHHGITTPRDPRFPFQSVSADEQIWGTYVHGIFDCADYRQALLEAWFGVRGNDEEDLPQIWMRDLDRLADVLVEHLDLSSLESRLGVSLS